MKKISILFLIFLMSVSAVFAVNARHGKKVWKKSCRLVCHDGSKSGVPPLSPVDMTQSQWKELFSNNRSEIESVHKKGELEKAKVNELGWQDMFKYLYDHALDSDQPETCG